MLRFRNPKSEIKIPPPLFLFPNKKKNPSQSSFFVRMKGLEPPRLSALDPKSSAATNYATSAWKIGNAKVQLFLI